MLENPAVLEALLGTAGLIAVATTAIFSRDSVKDRLEQLNAVKEQIEAKVEKRFSQLEDGLGYVQGRVNGLEEILEDGIITPSEVETIQGEIVAIKTKLGDLFRREDV